MLIVGRVEKVNIRLLSQETIAFVEIETKEKQRFSFPMSPEYVSYLQLGQEMQFELGMVPIVAHIQEEPPILTQSNELSEEKLKRLFGLDKPPIDSENPNVRLDTTFEDLRYEEYQGIEVQPLKDSKIPSESNGTIESMNQTDEYNMNQNEGTSSPITSKENDRSQNKTTEKRSITFKTTEKSKFSMDSFMKNDVPLPVQEEIDEEED